MAAERTELAWGRSALALFACGAALAKGIPRTAAADGHPLLGAVVLVGGGLIWLAGLPLARRRSGRRPGERRVRARTTDLLPLAVGTALIGLAGVVIASR